MKSDVNIVAAAIPIHATTNASTIIVIMELVDFNISDFGAYT